MKIDLSNATFIIPIKIESEDRLRNVITSVCFLLSNFNTNILIKEVDSESIFLKNALPQIQEFCGETPTLTHIFQKSDLSTFHRQKILNDMLMETTTDVVINYDCDVILPLESYVESYHSILSGNSDVVYPYGDGDYQIQVFATDEMVTNFLVNDFDFKYLLENSRIYDAKYGFCQFFRTCVYVEGGMENENFVAYAPEDVERFYRYNTLGYKVSRIDNFIFHLEHSRTPNSSFSNPHMSQNNLEWEKIKSMNSETLKNYIENQDYYRKRING